MELCTWLSLRPKIYDSGARSKHTDVVHIHYSHFEK